jgi:hypothetical protein
MKGTTGVSLVKWYAEQAALFGEEAARRHWDFSIHAGHDLEVREDVERLARVAAHFGRLALGESRAKLSARKKKRT